MDYLTIIPISGQFLVAGCRADGEVIHTYPLRFDSAVSAALWVADTMPRERLMEYAPRRKHQTPSPAAPLWAEYATIERGQPWGPRDGRGDGYVAVLHGARGPRRGEKRKAVGPTHWSYANALHWLAVEWPDMPVRGYRVLARARDALSNH